MLCPWQRYWGPFSPSLGGDVGQGGVGDRNYSLTAASGKTQPLSAQQNGTGGRMGKDLGQFIPMQSGLSCPFPVNGLRLWERDAAHFYFSF